MKRKRTVGSGPMRIGGTIEFEEDLYSMFYVSTFKPAYIRHCIITEEEKGMTEEQIRERRDDEEWL